MTTPVRESILNNVMATLMAIGPAASSIIVRNQTGFTLQTGGANLDADFDLYRVYVSTGGVQGVAKIRITPMLSTGVEGAEQGVTSGTGIELTANGPSATWCKITWTGSLVAGDCFYVKSGQGSSTPVNDFTYDIKFVSREGRIIDDLPEYPGIIVGEPEQQKTPKERITNVTMRLELFGGMKVDEPEVDMSNFIDRSMATSLLLQDIEQALKMDIKRGGYAIDTKIVSDDASTLKDATPNTSTWQLVEITYRHDWNNPAQSR